MTLIIKRTVLIGCLVLSASVAPAEDAPSPKTPLPLMVPHKKFSQDCGQCHLPKRWDVIRADFKYDHKAETGYALNGAHAQAKCVQCHNDRASVKLYSSRGCAGCHSDPHRSSLGPDCQRCHTEVSWRTKNSISDHARTAFPLTGAHLTADCQSCHIRAAIGDYKGVSIVCTSCHQADYQRAPNHVRFNYPRVCADCHRTTTFSGARFNHSFLANVADCYTCHQVDYNRAAHHVPFNYPRSCGDCHTTTTFSGARFNHGFLSGTADCYACHAADYQQAPDHVGSKATTCFNCHFTTTWQQTPAVPAPRPRP